MKTLLLFDANSLIHRAFHALPPLTSKDGAPAQALYGISSILIKLWRESKPEYAAALFDHSEETHRKAKYEAYKAQRKEIPGELAAQLDESPGVFGLFGVRTFHEPGFEADDLIATFAERFRGEDNVQVVILSGDLDALQLVQDDKVVVRAFKKGVSDTMTYNAAAVMERYGLDPSQMIDYKTLVGDASDNIKGVSGIGPKTASDILRSHGSIDKALQALHKDSRIRERLVENLEHIAFTRDLVTLNRSLPLTITSIEDLKVEEDAAALRNFFEEKGFQTLLKRFEGSGAPSTKKTHQEAKKSSQGHIF